LLDDGHEPQIHKSTTERFVYMANQIAAAFASQARPGADDAAVSATADHIRSFWDPSMRRGIFKHLDETGGEGLKPIALKALQRLRQVSAAAIEREVQAAGLHSGREPGDDAG
jgi:formate dehydrogenase subunit delta